MSVMSRQINNFLSDYSENYHSEPNAWLSTPLLRTFWTTFKPWFRMDDLQKQNKPQHTPMYERVKLEVLWLYILRHIKAHISEGLE